MGAEMKRLVFALMLTARAALGQTDEVLVPSVSPPLDEVVPDHFRIERVRISGGILGRAPAVTIVAAAYDSSHNIVNGGQEYAGTVTGNNARTLISALNKADMTSNTLQKRALTQLASQGVIPAGSASDSTCPNGIVCSVGSAGEVCTLGNGPCVIWTPSGGSTVETTTADYQVDSVELDWGLRVGPPAVTVQAVPRVSGGGDCVRFGPSRECKGAYRRFENDDAAAILADLETNNGNVKTIRRTLLERVRDDGALPSGTVVGSPFTLPN